MILNAGYLGIARAVAGDAEGRKLYHEACAAFAGTIAQADEPEKKEDAEFGLGQLQWVAKKFAPDPQ